jgi:hypothetical protein
MDRASARIIKATICVFLSMDKDQKKHKEQLLTHGH